MSISESSGRWELKSTYLDYQVKLDIIDDTMYYLYFSFI